MVENLECLYLDNKAKLIWYIPEQKWLFDHLEAIDAMLFFFFLTALSVYL